MGKTLNGSIEEDLEGERTSCQLSDVEREDRDELSNAIIDSAPLWAVHGCCIPGRAAVDLPKARRSRSGMTDVEYSHFLSTDKHLLLKVLS